jgi:hypothetical protein
MERIQPPPYDHDHENEVQLFAETNHRNRPVRFGIKTDDRRRHVYVIGKSGMGKTCLLENMFLSDVHAGHGCCFVDPHGDTADRFLDFIPPNRINDVVYFNPADTSFPIGFNILEAVDPDKKHLVANGLMAVFKKIWPDVWSARMEYILLNTILALLDVPGSTLLGINRLYVDEDYRKRVISLIQDPVVKTFWVKEFASFSEKYRTEAVAPVQNKVGQFLSSSIIRNVVAQTKSTIDVREIMDSRKIFIINLSKGLLGEENARLLGAMLITRLQLAAMERVDMKEKDRQDFYLYVDEFQNFATEAFASILSEARKYRLGLIIAHQYIEQLDETVAAAVFGNVGTMISFRVGGPDSEALEKEFAPTFMAPDLIGLTKYNVYLRLLIDGVASQPFSAVTLPPIGARTGSEEKIIRVSRERYGKTRAEIEKGVIKWAGYGTADAGSTIKTEDETADEEQMTDDERHIEEQIKELQASSPYVGEMAQSVDGGFGKKKDKKAAFEIPCSVCGEMQKLTFEPDWSKPWFCKNHLEMRNTPMARRLPSVAELTGRELPEKNASFSPSAAAPSRPVAPPPRPPSLRAERGNPAPPPASGPALPRAQRNGVEGPPSSNRAVPAPGGFGGQAAPPLSSGRPRIVVSSGPDTTSDADELRAAVGKPRDEKEIQKAPVPPLTSPIVERELPAAASPARIERIETVESPPVRETRPANNAAARTPIGSRDGGRRDERREHGQTSSKRNDSRRDGRAQGGGQRHTSERAASDHQRRGNQAAPVASRPSVGGPSATSPVLPRAERSGVEGPPSLGGKVRIVRDDGEIQESVNREQATGYRGQETKVQAAPVQPRPSTDAEGAVAPKSGSALPATSVAPAAAPNPPSVIASGAKQSPPPDAGKAGWQPGHVIKF